MHFVNHAICIDGARIRRRTAGHLNSGALRIVRDSEEMETSWRASSAT